MRFEMLSEGATEEEAKTVSAHFEYLKDLQKQGILILAGRTLNTDESSFGIVIFNAESREQARMIMESDPAVVHSVMHAELYPYRVALMVGG
jgi:uncharacterized protein YciI